MNIKKFIAYALVCVSIFTQLSIAEEGKKDFLGDILAHLAGERLLMDSREAIEQALQWKSEIVFSADTLGENFEQLHEFYDVSIQKKMTPRPTLTYLINHENELFEKAGSDPAFQKKLSALAELYTNNLLYFQGRVSVDVQAPSTIELQHAQALSLLPEWFIVPTPPVSDTNQAILIDISDQRMYVYEEGVLIGVSPITSGKNGYGTIRGTFSVKKKQEHKILTSPFKNDYYRLHVDYWIQFHKGFGIHDACNSKNCWRKEFGTQDYKTRGSHGCVNTPHEFVAWLYKWSLPGTVVKVQK